MNFDPINFEDKLQLISEHWSPRIVARMNNYYFKLVKVQGEFVWHNHPETDEVFMILKGQLELQFPEGSVELHEGEMFVVPRGLEHRPVAIEECHLMLVEPEGVVNTGAVVDEKTAPMDVWL